MNFKKYYINGDRFSLYITYRGKNHKISIEESWNNLTYNLTLFTTKRLVMEKVENYFVVYMIYFFKKRFMGKFPTKEEALERIKNMDY